MHLSLLYRGPLSSCNYDCKYCPFAKQTDSKQELEQDSQALKRFVRWCERQTDLRLRVFFTPWGEALTRRWYWEAIRTLSHLRHVEKVAVQTNLSCKLTWLEECQREKLGIWATFHPSQVRMEQFLEQIRTLELLRVPFSVGVVGLKEDFSWIEKLRVSLPRKCYLWVNAYKREATYYSAEDRAFLRRIDPYFETNGQYHASLGRECRTGQSVISVDGQGNVRRCHFVDQDLGNLYEQDVRQMLKPRACPNLQCGCHIGYVHLPHLKQSEIYGEGLLERIPRQFVALHADRQT